MNKLRLKAYDKKRKTISESFVLNDIQRGILFQGKKVFDLNHCIIIQHIGFNDCEGNELFFGDICEWPVYLKTDLGENGSLISDAKPVDELQDYLLFKDNTISFNKKTDYNFILLKQKRINSFKVKKIGCIYQAEYSTELV